MWKYFYSKGTYKSIDKLDDLAYNFNNTKSNEGQVWNMLFDQNSSEYPLTKFKVVNTVRISKYKSVFTKGYKANFTDQLFNVVNQ